MAYPTTAVLDSFTRADSGGLGSNWTTNIEGSATSGHKITGNQAEPLGNFASSYWNSATYGPDCEARITMATKPTDGFGIAAFARLQSPGSAACDGYCAAVSTTAGADDYALFRIDNGAWTQIGAKITEERTNGDVIGLECIGTTLTAYIGATSKVVRTDSTYTGVGYIGFEGDQATSKYDDFGGGTIVSTTSLAGNLTPDLTFAGAAAPATSIAGNLTPDITFAGNVTVPPPTSLAGNLTPDLTFAGNVTATSPASLIGNLTPDLTFAGNATALSPTSLAGNLTPDLTFAGAAENVPTGMAGDITPDITFAGTLSSVGGGGSLAGNLTPDLTFAGAAENVPTSIAGNVDEDLTFAGNLTSAAAGSLAGTITEDLTFAGNLSSAGAASLAGNLTPDLTFAGTLSGGLPVAPIPPRYFAGPLPWMVYGGVEIGNAARTLAYLSNRYDSVSNPNGLANVNGAWRVGQNGCCVCPVLATDGAGIDVEFLRPDDLGVSVGDPAPWWDPGVPESAEFLGVLITQITGLDSTVGRAKVERAAGLGGAALGAQRSGGREIGVKATLVATSCPGLDYGRRWLSHALANDLCDDCETYQLELRTTCPPDDRPDVGLVNLYEVGLSEGPKVVRDNGLPECCDLLEVEWTLTAGNPLMYACPVAVVAKTLVPPSGVVSATIDPPEPFGTIAAQIDVDTGTQAPVGVLIRIWDQLTADPCPGVDGDECLSIRLSGLPAGVRVSLDGARQRLSVTDLNGVVTDGLPYVVMSDGQAFDWPEFVGCQRVCVAVGVYVEPGTGGAATAGVAISSQQRFLA